jgi:hypothetical protein
MQIRLNTIKKFYDEWDWEIQEIPTSGFMVGGK